MKGSYYQLQNLGIWVFKMTKNIIAFIAHPDDEVNCAGLMHKNYKSGGNNLIICFTGNELRIMELKKSCEVIGAELLFLGFEEYNIKNDISLINKMRKIFVEFKPNIAVLQANDYHPDHIVVNKISLELIEFVSHGTADKAYLIPKILEMEASGLIPYPDIIIDITKEQSIRKKVFNMHKSQVKNKSFGDYYIKFLEQKAKLRGVQIGTLYGEAYKEHKLSIKGNFYPVSRGVDSIENL